LITASSSSAFAPGGGFGGKAFIRSTSALMQSSSGSGAAVRGGLPLLPGPVWSAACLAWLRLGLPSSPHAEVRTRARGACPTCWLRTHRATLPSASLAFSVTDDRLS
jgi:hypothetical protein